MENRIDKLFKEKNRNILSVYFTAGYPRPEDTADIIKQLEKNGVDLIEIGMPFSDPTADGPEIQRSSEIALKNGMNLHLLFEQLSEIRQSVNIPLVLMGYINPVLRFGMETFCRQCKKTGIDGLILPDLPMEEFQLHFRKIFLKNQLHNILLITPQTSDERIKIIDQTAGGFIYMVSSDSTTGTGKKVSDFHKDYFERINKMDLNNPRLIGFGISDHETFLNACKYASGAIIGSAFIRSFRPDIKPEESIRMFIKSIRGEKIGRI
jgi:tryptophan synthase alpha chain